MFGLGEIWLLLLVPVLSTVILLIFFMKNTKWWELLLVWGVTIVTIIVSQVITETNAVSDKELWGFNGVEAYYDEPFEYWTTCTETYACGQTCTGSGSSRSCTTNYCTRTYPCTKWSGNVSYLIDQTGDKHRIQNNEFNHIAEQLWTNKTFVDLHREKEYNIETDGDRYVSKWPGTWQTAQPIVERHTYENRTQCSTTMQFKKVTDKEKETYHLFDYPFKEGMLSTPTILDADGTNWEISNKYFNYINGQLGPERFLRIWVLIFRDQPLDAMHYQEGYWKNGNKNEFIICIGASSTGEVQWGGVISWTEVEELKIEFRDYINMKMKTVSEDSLLALAEYSKKELGSRYVKPEFTDKFQHLSVQPSTTAMVIVAIVVLLTNIGTVIFVVANGIDNEDVVQHNSRSTWQHPAVNRGSLKRTGRSHRRRILK